MTAIRLFARTARGLEWVAAAELRGRLGARPTRHRHREVWFELDEPTPALLALRTVDDVFASAGTVDGVGHQRAALEHLRGGVARLDLRSTLATRAAWRPDAGNATLEVVASHLGRRNYSRFDVEDAVGPEIAGRTGSTYLSRRSGEAVHAATTWRVHIADDEAVIGLRIADRPLHRRPYKVGSQLGTLHPPAAAALALLAGVRPNATWLDPFAGLGTIALEAVLLEPGVHAAAFDVAALATEEMRRHALAAATSATLVTRSDATSLPLRAGCIDRIATNPPWGRQVDMVRSSGGWATVWDELARVAAPGVRLAMLVEEIDDAAAGLVAAGWELAATFPISVSGRHPTAVIATRTSGAEVIDGGGLYGDELTREHQQHRPVASGRD